MVYFQFEIGSDWLLSLLTIPEYEILSFENLIVIVGGLPLMAAVIMGVYSARIVSKYLNYSLEDLY